MDEAMNLSDSARINMPKPTLTSLAASSTPSSKQQQQSVKKPAPSRLTEVTFKSIAEEYAAEHNLLFMPIGRVHEKSRIPMYRVTGRTDGKGGIVVYILDDVLWSVEGGAPDGAVTALTLEEMVLQASKAR
jgi:tuftelin-interacting protein 11